MTLSTYFFYDNVGDWLHIGDQGGWVVAAFSGHARTALEHLGGGISHQEPSVITVDQSQFTEWHWCLTT